jgi:hypothetical protein
MAYNMSVASLFGFGTREEERKLETDLSDLRAKVNGYHTPDQKTAYQSVPLELVLLHPKSATPPSKPPPSKPPPGRPPSQPQSLKQPSGAPPPPPPPPPPMPMPKKAPNGPKLKKSQDGRKEKPVVPLTISDEILLRGYERVMKNPEALRIFLLEQNKDKPYFTDLLQRQNDTPARKYAKKQLPKENTAGPTQNPVLERAKKEAERQAAETERLRIFREKINGSESGGDDKNNSDWSDEDETEDKQEGNAEQGRRQDNGLNARMNCRRCGKIRLPRSFFT